MQTPIKNVLLAVTLATAVAGCTDSKQYETSFCSLIDVSGTYAGEKSSVVNTVKAGIVPQMIPGDSLFFVKIDSNSYSEDNLVTKLTLDYRPTRANSQKMAVARTLDDFGKGLSSFGYLRTLPVDYIKIDAQFVRDLLSDPIDLAMVRSINDVARLMAKRTIAEGVESHEVLGVLREIGVDFAQGYAIGEPRFID